MQTMYVSELRQHHGNIFSMPRVTALLLNEVGHFEIDRDRVERLVAADPGLTLRVMQVANASLPSLVSTAGEALRVMRDDQLRQLCSVVAVNTEFIGDGLDIHQFWRVSLNAGKTARYLAKQIQSDPGEAFTAGILHAIGEVFIQSSGSASREMKSSSLRPFDFGRSKLEKKLLGFCFADVGADYLARWRFPDEIVRALRYQIAPLSGARFESSAAVVHLANWRALAVENRLSPNLVASRFPYQVALALGLDIDIVMNQQPVDWHAQTIL